MQQEDLDTFVDQLVSQNWLLFLYIVFSGPAYSLLQCIIIIICVVKHYFVFILQYLDELVCDVYGYVKQCDQAF